MNEINEEDQQNVTNPNDLEQLEILLDTLLQQKLKLAEEKRYFEAEEIKDQIEKTKKRLSKKKKEYLMIQHLSEMRQLEEKYTIEVSEFNEEWDNKLRAYQEEAKVQEAALKERQIREMQEMIQIVENSTNKLTMKFSPQYNQLTQAEERLVKQDKFKEAQVLANKRVVLEKAEIEKFNKEKLVKQRLRLEAFEKKQENERYALKKKLEIEYDVLKNQRVDEYDKLIYKFKNRKLGLEIQQKQEKNLTENDNMNKQKITADTIRNFHKPNSKQFFSSKSNPRAIRVNAALKTNYEYEGSNENKKTLSGNGENEEK